MKLNTTPDNQVELSGIVAVSEFKIRNSAKAFNILSSGLYSNKIRAILREIGCNAVDSHVAAGRGDVPFDLHLPTQLAPYFSIRDYGTGLSHDQVVNIYTTYFESTKTESNDFIGALGLGSKSPFSYTDNFTVTAIRDGIKGVYSAFINEVGVPSVALMTSSQTDEPNGVEVQFGVEKEQDIYNFKKEATTVYRYFKVKPNLTGATVDMAGVEYITSIELPGAAVRKGERGSARAVMGNIAYPIQLESQEREVVEVLNSPIDMFFDIGDVDFQASREGLSYDKATVAAILKRVEEIRAVLEGMVARQVDPIPNMWDKIAKLQEISGADFLQLAVNRYMFANQRQLPVYNWPHGLSGHYGGQYRGVAINVPKAAEKFNVSVRAFETAGYSSAREVTAGDWDGNDKLLAFQGLLGYQPEYLLANPDSAAVIDRVKYNLRNAGHNYNATKEKMRKVFVLSPADKTKPMDLNGFVATLHNPTPNMWITIDELIKKPAKARTQRRVDVMRSEWVEGDDEAYWRPCLKPVADFDKKQTYYYVKLKGFEATNSKGAQVNIKAVHKLLIKSKLEGFEFVYGVRAADLPAVEKRKNWVPLDKGIAKALKTITPEQFYGMSVKKIDRREVFQYVKRYVTSMITSPDSPIHELLGKIGQPSKNGELGDLCKLFAPHIDPLKLEEAAHTEVMKMVSHYPLLLSVQPRHVDGEYQAVADYINLIDQTRKVN